MPVYRYTGNDSFRRGDGSIDPGEIVELPESSVEGHENVFEEVDPDDLPDTSGNEEESEPGSSEEAESEAESESEGEADDSPEEEQEAAESGEEEPQDGDEGEEAETDGGLVEIPLDPGDLTIEQLEAELSAGDFSDEELDAILDAEESGEDRKGAKDAIESAKGG